MATVLVTGGAGYIGSHTSVELIKAGHRVIIVDDLSNGRRELLEGIRKITGIEPIFIQVDITERKSFLELFDRHPNIDAIIHFAASKFVGESVSKPLLYYRNNILSLINILEAMDIFRVPNLVFSSSCTVYGQPDQLPVTELTPFKPAESPYGNTKQICEEIIRDTCKVNNGINAISLRYFNPVGAHDSVLIGEYPKGKPNNLVPFITETAAGIRQCLHVFGGDYETIDGTAVRDYIHISDLALAHVAALQRQLSTEQEMNYEFYNVGTGSGLTVLQVIRAFEATNRIKVPFEIVARRSGDIASIYADTTLANEKLKWRAVRSLEEMMSSAWRWQSSLR